MRTSVDALPVELLRAIFEEYTFVDEQSPVALLLVCKRWMDVAGGFKKLWTRICLSDQASVNAGYSVVCTTLRAALDAIGRVAVYDYSLTIQLHEDFQPPEDDWAEWTRIVGSSQSRCHTLRLLAYKGRTGLLSACRFPQLTELELRETQTDIVSHLLSHRLLGASSGLTRLSINSSQVGTLRRYQKLAERITSLTINDASKELGREADAIWKSFVNLEELDIQASNRVRGNPFQHCPRLKRLIVSLHNFSRGGLFGENGEDSSVTPRYDQITELIINAGSDEEHPKPPKVVSMENLSNLKLYNTWRPISFIDAPNLMELTVYGEPRKDERFREGDDAALCQPRTFHADVPSAIVDGYIAKWLKDWKVLETMHLTYTKRGSSPSPLLLEALSNVVCSQLTRFTFVMPRNLYAVGDNYTATRLRSMASARRQWTLTTVSCGWYQYPKRVKGDAERYTLEVERSSHHWWKTEWLDL